MAGILSSFIDRVSDNIGSGVVKVFKELAGVDKELMKLENTLLMIREVLEDAEARQEKEAAVKRWLAKLRDVAFDIDDLLDEIATEAGQQPEREEGDNDGHTKKKACAAAAFLKSHAEAIFKKMNIAKRIGEIQESLDEIAGEIERYNLIQSVQRRNDDTTQSVSVGRETASYVDESTVFGRDEDKKKVIVFLKDETCSNPDVLSIVGLGGLGKTTLAQLAYNEVRYQFDLAMWVYVSDYGDDFFVKRVATSILNSITRSQESGIALDLDYIQRDLRERLKNRRFLLVLDDVWNENGDKWERSN